MDECSVCNFYKRDNPALEFVYLNIFNAIRKTFQ
jgi:hypothetical protein